MQAKSRKRDEAVEVVKRRLWSHGFRAKAATGAAFDLLVEGKYRVAVRRKGAGADPDALDFDVMAVVEFPAMGRAVVGYRAVGSAEVSTSPAFVFIKSTGKVHGKKGKEKVSV